MAQIDGPVLRLCCRCFGLYEPHIRWLRDSACIDRDDVLGVDYAALEWASENAHHLMKRAVQLSRLFKGVARAAGRLRLAQRRAAERIYVPGGDGYVEAASGFAEASLRLRGSGLERELGDSVSNKEHVAAAAAPIASSDAEPVHCRNASTLALIHPLPNDAHLVGQCD